MGGIGRFEGRSVVVIGTERGAELETRLRHNFGMARPEGYRKAVRLMSLAARFGLPVLSFVDTPGAFPASRRKRVGRPRRSPVRSMPACHPRCRSWPP